MDVQLEIGNVSETVVVTSGVGEALLNRDDGSLGNNFVNQQITQLPLEARNVLSLVTLQPGVTPQGYVTGARSDQSNITLDGVDINEAQTNSISSPVLRLNSEAIEEFRVEVFAKDAMREIKLVLEPSADLSSTGELAEQVSRRMRERIGLRPIVELVAPGTLPRFELKARRFFKL